MGKVLILKDLTLSRDALLFGGGMNGIEVRRYGHEGDLERIVALDEACFSGVFRFSHEAMRRFVEAKRAICLIAESGGDLVGFVVVEVDRTGEMGYVVTLDVAEGFRRGGVARRLMSDVEGEMCNQKVAEMALHVYEGNEGAIRFYEALGYSRTGVQRGFYGAGLNALVYRKMLPTR